MAQRIRVFITSAGENLQIAHNLQEILSIDYEVTVWDQAVFSLSEYALESLERALQQNDVGIVIFTPTDLITMRSVTSPAPRDNVVFELGMFMARFGRIRSYIVLPEGSGIRLPTDILGLQYATYDAIHSNAVAGLQPAANKISRAISSAQTLRHSDGNVPYTLFTTHLFPRFAQGLLGSTNVDILFIHSRRWRENLLVELEGFVNKDQSRLRVFLPDLRIASLVEQLRTRFDDGPRIPDMIADAYLLFGKLQKAHPGQTTVRLYKRIPAYSCYRFDDSLFVAIYPTSQKRQPSPTLLTTLKSDIGAFITSDLQDLSRRDESSQASADLLLRLARAWSSKPGGAL